MIHKARKRFGQNFLHDQAIIYNILGSLQAQANEHWIEIGPGQGALTKPLLDMGIRLDVVELDRDLVVWLQKNFLNHPRLTIHSADALSFDFAGLADAGEKMRVIGNLPYNISTPLLFHLLENTAVIEDMTFMLQKEVVERMCAPPGSKTYGRLSIMMQYHCATEFLFEVPPESFDPIPKVTSAIIKLTPHHKKPVEVNNFTQMGRIITQAFSQRRKTLRNALKKIIDESSLANLGIDPVRRPETLTLAEFAAISNAVQSIDN
ncbi:MAG: 16S rRNA (adenine(1518)-N(6)/adenine(1519)-N(6))-dimethyltransferase RsmA [Methylococcales bacterium]|nr:16S rRNA (adenine(1518)-N(6)/adenine(1519)-N(6))-dimethyltransferase RsmA [Methylococcales bacterium]